MSVYLVFVLILLLIGLQLLPQPQDKVVFLDVGQGDAILLQDGTNQILIDGGPGNSVLRRLGEEMPWFDRKIEVVIATHPDRDHLEGLLHVLERYDVELVVLPQLPHTSQLQHEWLEKLEAALKTNDITYRFAWRGQQVRTPDISLEILWPLADSQDEIINPAGKTNNAAVLTRVDFHDRSFLLTSDAETVVERALVKSFSPPYEGGVPRQQAGGRGLDVDILKAGHHGSKTSTTQELIDAASPSAVVISVGAKNSYGHPHPTVLDRLQEFKVLRTDQQGSVRFWYERGQWRLNNNEQSFTLEPNSGMKSSNL